MSHFRIPAQRNRVEIEVLKSRFIASIAPAFSVDQARAFIQEIKKEFSDASHNVPAFLIGHGASVIAHSSDDGEPSGTAGRPALIVLQGSGLGDVVVVVTRYFGGTKLGTGGLVRAYTDAVKEVLIDLPLAFKVATYLVMVVIPYTLFEQVRLLVQKYQGVIQDEDFGADVTMTIQFRQEKLELFNLDLNELSHGLIRAEIIESNSDTIFPIGK